MKKMMQIPYLSLLVLALLACERRPAASENTASGADNDTIVVTRRETKVSRELDELRDWMNNKTNRVDSGVDENWPEVKAELKARMARLDAKADSLSAESKAEYAELKARYQEWETKKERREDRPLDPGKLKQWEQQLLGGKTLIQLNGTDMREAYLVFMGVVRAQRHRWTQDDWDYVDNVYGRLNDRKQVVESQIPSAHRLKIKALQAEYLTLEAGHDASDVYQHVKK